MRVQMRNEILKKTAVAKKSHIGQGAGWQKNANRIASFGTDIKTISAVKSFYVFFVAQISALLLCPLAQHIIFRLGQRLYFFVILLHWQNQRRVSIKKLVHYAFIFSGQRALHYFFG